MPRIDINKVYMNIAEEISQLSYAERKKVGCILVKDGTIISHGYNGTPYGFENDCEEYEERYYENDIGAELLQDYGYELIDGVARKLVTKREVLHAESNAISKVAKSSNSSEDADLYVTLSPCFECAKLIIQSGIKRVFYREEYRQKDGLDLLIKAGIQCLQC
jgi:dCMP deaminase